MFQVNNKPKITKNFAVLFRTSNKSWKVYSQHDDRAGADEMLAFVKKMNGTAAVVAPQVVGMRVLAGVWPAELGAAPGMTPAVAR